MCLTPIWQVHKCTIGTRVPIAHFEDPRKCMKWTVIVTTVTMRPLNLTSPHFLCLYSIFLLCSYLLFSSMFLFMLCPSLTLLRHVTGYSCTGYRHLCSKAPFYLTDWTPLDITTTWFPVSVPFPLTFLCMPPFCFSIVPIIHSPLLLYIKVVLLKTYSLV